MKSELRKTLWILLLPFLLLFCTKNEFPGKTAAAEVFPS